MKWIKASERLPETNKTVNAKYTNNDGTKTLGVAENVMDNGNYILYNHTPAALSKIEWLDETESKPVGGDGKLYEALKAIMDYFNQDEITVTREIYTLAFKAITEYESPLGYMYEAECKEREYESSPRSDEVNKLVEAAKELLHLHLCEQEGIGSGQPTRIQWLTAVDNISEALKPYEK
jgi:hypothetical protein